MLIKMMVSLEILRQLKLTSYKRYVDDKERRTAMMIYMISLIAIT